MRTLLTASLVSGAVAGVVAFAAFLVTHAIWIVPIWDVAPIGVVYSILAGVAVGWAYDIHRPRLPARSIGRVGVVFAATVLALVPAEVVALT